MTSEQAIKEAEAYLASQQTGQPSNASTMSDEELIRHLPDEALLQHINQSAQPAAQAPPMGIGDIRLPMFGFAPIKEYPRMAANTASAVTLGMVPPDAFLGGQSFANRFPPVKSLGGNLAQMIGQGAVYGAGIPGQAGAGVYKAASSVLPKTLLGEMGAGAAAGAVGGGLTNLGTPRSIPANAGMGAAAGFVTPPIVRGVQSVAKIPDFLRGNTKAIGKAEDALDQAAHETVKTLRPQGRLHNRVMATISQESSKAWAPMQEVANAIPGDIPVSDLRTVAATRFGNDPARLQALELLFKQIEEEGTAYSAPELVDLSSQMGRVMTKAGLRGTAARTFSDMVYSDARSLIADTLEQRAPVELKGAVQLAKQQWAAYATDRDALFRTFALGAPQNAPTSRGVNLLKRASLGNATPHETELLNRVQQTSGLDLPAELKTYAEKLLKARTAGEVGKTITRIAPWLTGAGVAREVFRKR